MNAINSEIDRRNQKYFCNLQLWAYAVYMYEQVKWKNEI